MTMTQIDYAASKDPNHTDLISMRNYAAENRNLKEVRMLKKTMAVIFSLCFVLLCGCGKANIDRVAVDYGKSEIYSQQDMDSAIGVIKKEFSSWEGCELHTISYVSDEICKDNVDYCNELKENAGYDECIVFESSFHSPISGGDAWTPDNEYTGWNWYLARKDNGAWTLLTWGYA